MAGGHRAAVGRAREAVAAVWRTESARIVGALARCTGDFALAEDVAQEALALAAVVTVQPRVGCPRSGRRRGASQAIVTTTLPQASPSPT